MKRLLVILLCCWLTMPSNLLAMADEYELPIGQLLEMLDDVIAQKEKYHQKRQAVGDSLRKAADRSMGQERIALLKQLHYNYENYHADSTFLALEMLKQTPEYSTDTTLQQYVYLAEARAYGIKGLYSTAFEMLGAVDVSKYDSSMRLRYHNTRYAVTGWFADFAAHYSPSLSSRLTAAMSPINDTLYALEPVALNRRIIRTNKFLIDGQYQASVDSLLQVLDDLPVEQRTFIYSGLAQAYGKLGRKEEELRYLTLTAINDIRQGNAEYMALPLLAQRTFELGQTERAYRYLICSLEDANFCKASLRTVESTQIFPIIDHAIKSDEERENRYMTTALIVLSLFLIMLVAGILQLWRQQKKLNHARQALSKVNNELKISNLQLKDFNRDLAASDKVKEEYILKYLGRCRRYLGAFESYQRQMYKLMQTHQIEELGKQLKSTQVINDEQMHFYQDFDEAFLKLYPHFIDRFNALLKPDAQIIPKKGELLTTELRIFALIRLGETDSAQIAKFLNYSLTTIYNYRSRVRNNAIGDKDNFENEVIKL